MSLRGLPTAGHREQRGIDGHVDLDGEDPAREGQRSHLHVGQIGHLEVAHRLPLRQPRQKRHVALGARTHALLQGQQMSLRIVAFSHRRPQLRNEGQALQIAAAPIIVPLILHLDLPEQLLHAQLGVPGRLDAGLLGLGALQQPQAIDGILGPEAGAVGALPARGQVGDGRDRQGLVTDGAVVLGGPGDPQAFEGDLDPGMERPMAAESCRSAQGRDHVGEDRIDRAGRRQGSLGPRRRRGRR